MTLTELLASGSVYVLTGIMAGLMSGLMGVGGGIIVVPALIFIFNEQTKIPPNLIMQMAAGTSLAIMLFTSQSSIRAHYKQNGILWEVYNRLWPGIILGTISGAFLADKLSTYWIKTLFAVFLILVAVKILTERQRVQFKPISFPKNWVNRLITFLIGCKSGLLGVGGGVLIIPYLNYCGVEMKKIAPISALSTMTVAAIGTIIFIITGLQEQGLPPYTSGFIYWPAVIGIAIPSSFFAPLGAKLTYILPVKQLKYCFLVILVATAIKLLI